MFIKACVLAAVLFVVMSSTADAQCNEICREKCRQTAHFGGLTVAQCIEKWAVINRDPALARRLEDKGARIRRSYGYR